MRAKRLLKNKDTYPKKIFTAVMESIPNLVTEYTPIEGRKFAIDWSIPDLKIAIEYEGGIHSTVASHRSKERYLQDIEKYNLLAVNGWVLLRFTALDIGSEDKRNNIYDIITDTILMRGDTSGRYEPKMRYMPETIHD